VEFIIWVMPRATDFVDPEYDRKLAEFRARKEELKRQMAEQAYAKKRDGLK